MPVVVQGIVGFKKALGQLAPDIKKEMDKEIREALKPILKDAKSKVPGQAPGGLYNYNDPGYERKSRTGRKRAFPSYDATAIRRGLTYSLGTKNFSGKGYVSAFTLLNRSASGAIIETAGRANPGGSPRSQSNNKNAGRRFIAGMNGVGALTDYAGRGKMTTGRLLYAAYARNQGAAVAATMKAIDKAKLAWAIRIKTSKETAA